MVARWAREHIVYWSLVNGHYSNQRRFRMRSTWTPDLQLTFLPRDARITGSRDLYARVCHCITGGGPYKPKQATKFRYFTT